MTATSTDTGPLAARSGMGPATSPAGRPRSRGTVAIALSAATVMASASSLAPVIVGGQWWVPALLAAAAVTLTGILGATARWPRFVTILVQIASLAALLWVLYPPSDFGGYDDLLRDARTHIVTSVPPAPWISVLGFVIAAFLGILVIVATQLATLMPALVAVPALVAFLTGSTFAERALPWPVFVAPALCYLALLLTTAPRRSGTGTGGRGRGSARGAVAALTVAGVVVGIGYLGQARVTSVPTWGLLERTGYEGPAMFTSLTGDLLRGPEVDLLQVVSPYPAGYLRTSSLEVWEPGVGWSMGELEASAPERENPPLFDVQITSLGYEGRFLPVAHGTTDVVSDQSWTRDANLNAWYRSGVINPGQYTISVYTPSSIDGLLAATVTPGELTETGELDPMVTDLAQQVVGGRVLAFEKAVAVRDFFLNPANGFVYSLYLPRGESGDPLVDFLTNRTGYCQQYASAMAVMLRALGIPSRVVVGFAPGEQQEDGTYLVTSHDAHAWVEARFDDWGWFPFDPTPPAGSPARTRTAEPTPSATETAAEQAAPDDALVPLNDGASASAAVPTVAATTPPADAVAEEPQDAGGQFWPVLGWGAGIAALLAAPWLVRQVRRRLRLFAIAARRRDAAELTWAEIRDLATDFRVKLPATASLREDARTMVMRARLNAAARAQLDEVVAALERAWYAPARASGPPGGGAGTDSTGGNQDWVALIGQVQAGLRKYRARTWTDQWFPRSLRPRTR